MSNIELGSGTIQQGEGVNEYRQGSPTIMFIESNISLSSDWKEELVSAGLNVVSLHNDEDLSSFQERTNVNLAVIEKTDLIKMKRNNYLPKIPYIVVANVTSQAEETEQRISDLNEGAEFFLTKEASPALLSACINATLRRSKKAGKKDLFYSFADMEYDPAGVLYKEKRSVTLSSHEAKVLYYLWKNINKMISKEEILRRVWGEEYANDDQYLRVMISRLRTKINRITDEVHIKSFQGLGYIMTELDKSSK